jgi:hypothetical protein
MRNSQLASPGFLIVSLVLCGALSACGKQEQAPPAAAVTAERQAAATDAGVFFVTPEDGATVTSPFGLEFGATGMAIVPAGTDQAFSGHHHLLIDVGLPDEGLPIPKDANHVHFGDGGFVTEISLEPGQHTLQLILGDHRHIPHDPPVVSERITITVE